MFKSYNRFIIYSIVISILIMLTGCGTTTVTKPIIKTETVEVKVPVKCNIPKVECNLHGKDFEVIGKMLECIVEQKRAIEVCSE